MSVQRLCLIILIMAATALGIALVLAIQASASPYQGIPPQPIPTPAVPRAPH